MGVTTVQIIRSTFLADVHLTLGNVEIAGCQDTMVQHSLLRLGVKLELPRLLKIGSEAKMTIKILFFGATAEETGKRSLELPIEDSTSARTAFDEILKTFPKLNSHKLLFAVNQEYVAKDHILLDGDELAIFTAVSGG